MRETIPDVWSTEPALTEMLADPIIHALMKADGFGRRDVCEILLKAVQSGANAADSAAPSLCRS